MKRIWPWVLATIILLLVVLVGRCMENRLGGVRFSNWGAYLTGAGSVLLVLVAAFTATTAVKEYKNRVAAEKARWLFELFEKFYENGSYKVVRQQIDYEETEAILNLIRKDEQSGWVPTKDEKQLFDEFTDYLNFFEMVAYWKSQGQLDQRDIDAMFEYYLERLVEVDKDKAIRNYLKKEGFEYLNKLLLEYEEG